MGFTKWQVLPLLAVLIAGCATTEKNSRDAESTSAEAPTTVSAQTEKTPMPSMNAAQQEALAMVLEVMRAGEWQTAHELAQELILAHPKLAAAYANVGNIHQQLGDLEKAEQAWLKALELNPGWAAVYNQLGIFYRDQARFEPALAMYQKAIATDEAYANSHRNIAILYEIYLGDKVQALQHYRRYRELVAGEPREVTLWIADLERRVKRSGQ